MIRTNNIFSLGKPTLKKEKEEGAVLHKHKGLTYPSDKYLSLVEQSKWFDIWYPIS